MHIRVERHFSTPRIHDIIKGEHNISEMANYTCGSVSGLFGLCCYDQSKFLLGSYPQGDSEPCQQYFL